MPIKEIRYVTKDGMEFRTEDAALNHENEMDFVDWYDNQPDHTEAITGDEIVDWLLQKDVKEKVFQLYKNER
jgi:hypothetical protein